MEEDGGDSSNNRGDYKVEVDKEKALEDFLVFFENMYEELGKFGRIEALHVCDNLGDHMIGHVYAKFSDEEEASDALNVMNGRYYDGRKMEVEFSPVTDFREARCRDFDEDTCSRGGFCNFMHIKPIPMCLIRSLEEDCDEERRREYARRMDREYRERERERRKRKRRDRESSHRDRGDRDSHRGRDRDRERSGRDRRSGSSGGGADRDSKRRRDDDDDAVSGAAATNDNGDGGSSGDAGGRRGRSYSRSPSRSASPSPSGRRGDVES